MKKNYFPAMLVIFSSILAASCGTVSPYSERAEYRLGKIIGTPPPVYEVGGCRLTHSGYFVGSCGFWLKKINDRSWAYDAVVQEFIEAARGGLQPGDSTAPEK